MSECRDDICPHDLFVKKNSQINQEFTASTIQPLWTICFMSTTKLSDRNPNPKVPFWYRQILPSAFLGFNVPARSGITKS
ncbi:hypothetical protein Fmac_011928 [Flemingia macrophylla]|uniref:Ycf15 n=1 Tax=Flemingia macrophylla TaxID=520843 RepID=A0ABD1MNV3_9FABA